MLSDKDMADMRKAIANAVSSIGKITPFSQAVLRCLDEVDRLKGENAKLRDGLAWALDLLDLYDERLAQIDGPEAVYSDVHLAGKAKARVALSALKETP